MNILTKAGALRPVATRIAQGLVLHCLFALLALLGVVGANLSHAHQAAAPNGIWMAPASSFGDPGPTSVRLEAPAGAMAGTNGDIHIGS